jgi:hypothetical protein
MKLNSAQLERTLGQFEARAIPDDHPVIPQLNDLSSSRPRPPPGRRLSQPRS